MDNKGPYQVFLMFFTYYALLSTELDYQHQIKEYQYSILNINHLYLLPVHSTFFIFLSNEESLLFSSASRGKLLFCDMFYIILLSIKQVFFSL
jgi:hypothetical protein